MWNPLKILGYVLLALAAIGLSAFLSKNTPAETRAEGKPSLVSVITENVFHSKPREGVTIGFVGDIVPFADSDPFSSFRAEFSRPDILMGNLEGVLAQEDIVSSYAKCDPEQENCFVFAGSPSFAGFLRQASFDIVSLANNHSNDLGPEGQASTREALGEAGIAFTGGKEEIAVIEKNGVRVAFIGASPNVGSLYLMGSSLPRQIAKAESEADIVILFVHAGAEGIDQMRTPDETEYYLGENRGHIRKIAREAIDAGADAVIGSGPHVLRGMETYRGKPIAYSLGNFYADGVLRHDGALGSSILLSLSFDRAGTLTGLQMRSIQLDAYGRPQPDPTDLGKSLVHMLSLQDFGTTVAEH